MQSKLAVKSRYIKRITEICCKGSSSLVNPHSEHTTYLFYQTNRCKLYSMWLTVVVLVSPARKILICIHILNHVMVLLHLNCNSKRIEWLSVTLSSIMICFDVSYVEWFAVSFRRAVIYWNAAAVCVRFCVNDEIYSRVAVCLCLSLFFPDVIWFCILNFIFQADGSSVCKDRPPCSKKDYSQIHTACDSEGKVRQMRPLFSLTLCVITLCAPFDWTPFRCNFRHRSYISGLSLRSVLTVSLEPRRYRQAENESPAPLVTPVSTTMTQPPARLALPGPFLMGWNVLETLNS